MSGVYWWLTCSRHTAAVEPTTELSRAATARADIQSIRLRCASVISSPTGLVPVRVRIGLRARPRMTHNDLLVNEREAGGADG